MHVGSISQGRESLASPPRYFLIHIPKTAGISLLEVLRRALGEDNVYQRPVESYPSTQAINKFALVAGHFLLAEAMPLFASRKTLVFLRDPVDRVLSWYYFLRESPPLASDVNGFIAQAKELSLWDFVRSFCTREFSPCGNWQVWVLSGSVERTPESRETVLMRAKSNLERCASWD